MSKAPADFLKSIRGQRVIVKLNSGVDYKGEEGGALLLASLPKQLARCSQSRHPTISESYLTFQVSWLAWMAS